MSVKVYLYKTGAQQIFLSGDFQGETLVLNALEVSGLAGGASESFAVLAGDELRVPRSLLVQLDPAVADEFRFGVSAAGVTLSATFEVSAAAQTFFGAPVSAQADFRVSLVVRVPVAADRPVLPAFATIEGCGRFVIESSPVEFASEPLCFQVNVEEFPESFPSPRLPALDVELPDFGFNLPKLRLPWDFPRLPRLPLQFPTNAFDLAPLPIKVSWKSVRVSPSPPDSLVIDVRHLRIEGPTAAVEGDLHLVIVNGQVVFDRRRPDHSYFDLYRPDFEHLLRLAFDDWHFDERCALVRWGEGRVNDWLRLVAPDLAEEGEARAALALRVLRRGGTLEEIRLDWKTDSQPRTLRLPGFRVIFPPVRFYTLLLRERAAAGDGPDERRLTFISTLDADSTFTAKSTFTLNPAGQDERELMQDEQPREELIRFVATTQKPLSVAVMDLPLGGAKPVFFRQLDEPLVSILEDEPAVDADDLPEPPSECPPSRCEPDSLKQEDWRVDLEFDTSGFRFPFLRGGGGRQFITVKKGGHRLDFPNRTFVCELEVEIHVGALLKRGALRLAANLTASFNWETFAFVVRDEEGIKVKHRGVIADSRNDLLGLAWEFRPNAEDVLFVLTTKDRDYQLKQAEGSLFLVKYAEASSEQEPITFELRDFALTPKGLNLKARVRPSPVTLNGLNTRFRFTEGEIQIQENELRDFSLSGSGPLPPKLVGDAVADISLHFGTRPSGGGRGEGLQLISGAAQLRGKNLLKCTGTRFEFAVDGLGLKFVNDGRVHFYFTVTGRAKFVPLPSDDSSGPLAWLPAVELQLLDCPLTGDARVLSRHVKFLVELPKKMTFDFLGCFKMELRGIGFVPNATMFDADAAAMELSGQLMFSDGTGDLLDARVDFHSLFIGLPEPGKIVPRIHFRNLAVRVRSGDAFRLEGSVDYIDGEIEPGLQAKGFGGSGSLQIQGLPTFTAAFTFVRVSRDGGLTWVRAWFLYVQAGKLSLRVPVINVFIREIGLGFGYRYTLAMIKRSDEIDDPRRLLAELKRLSLTQGELSRRDQWRVDVEEGGQDPRWTVAARALIAQNSAAAGLTDWNEAAERELPSIFVIDVVLALRSDLTFLMTARGWLNTNYNDYLTRESLRSRPLLSGFVLLSPRRKRFLAHLSSNPGAEFGDHPPLPGFVKQAILQSNFSATLLIEPGLFHYELGWPNMLRWRAKIGPLEAEFRGGMIFRVSRRELVIGNSYMARGSLELSAQAGGGSVGARLSALAQVAYGARYIGVIGFDDPRGRSALYGAVGLEINVRLSIEFWLRLKFKFFRISINLRLSFSIGLTALLEVGVTAGDLIGARGTATVSLRIMGRGLHFKINVGINGGAVDAARRITSQFLNVGLEATEVDPLPGSTASATAARSLPASAAPPAAPSTTSSAPATTTTIEGGTAPPPSSPTTAPASAAAPPQPTAPTAPSGAGATVVAAQENFRPPEDGYSVFTIPLREGADGDGEHFLVLLPGDRAGRDGRQGFLPVPPKGGASTADDFLWEINQASVGTRLSRFAPGATAGGAWVKVDGASVGWKANWRHVIAKGQPVEKVNQDSGGAESPTEPDEVKLPAGPPADPVELRHLLANAFITVGTSGATGDELDFFNDAPHEDPTLPPTDDGTLEDARVHNPSDDAFEAAVRGAAEQFAGSPYFKPDPRSVYEQKLGEAFSAATSIYSEDGQLDSTAAREKAERAEQAIQMRGLVVNQMINDLQQYVALERLLGSGGGPAVQAQIDELIAKSVAFQMGLVFKTAAAPVWYKSEGNQPLGTIRQRNSFKNAESVSAAVPVGEFNKAAFSFARIPPQFQRVKNFADANTVAITWDLRWSSADLAASFGASTPQQREPEHHLHFYLIRRRSLAGGEREVEFRVKPVDALNLNAAAGEMEISGDSLTQRLPKDDKRPALDIFKEGQSVRIAAPASPENEGLRTITKVEVETAGEQRVVRLVFEQPFPKAEPSTRVIVSALQILKSRFQFVDHFNEETAEDQAALPDTGKSYVYTITPVDVTGAHSPRPLTVIATRLPNEPPQVPADGEMVVGYELEEGDYEGTAGAPVVVDPARIKILVEWTEPPDPPGKPHVVIAEYVLVFRRETAFPAGSYGHDAESRGGRTSGLPTSNARRLRTDINVPLDGSRIEVTTDPKTKVKLFRCAVPVDALPPAVLPRGGWRPESWRVFFQTRSAGNVQSALTPVQVVLRFSAGSTTFEERRPGMLEWVARPVRFGVLPPEDEKADVDFASVPVPQPPADESTLTGRLETAPGSILSRAVYLEHPSRLRCLRFAWNQGPSGGSSPHPVDLHAGYRLYEFDLDAHTARVLDHPPEDFLSRLRRTQEMEIVTAQDLLLTPANTDLANQWEAWYPSAARRRWLQERLLADASVPLRLTEAKLSPWYSWRDSFLEWPEDGSMFARDGDELLTLPGAVVKGEMVIHLDTQRVTAAGGLDVFRKGQYVRISGAPRDDLNGVKRVTDKSAGSLSFEAHSFPKGDDGVSVVHAALTIDGRPFTGLHPFLARLVEDLDDDFTVVDLNPPPTSEAVDLETLLRQSAPLQDPYGWNILKRMGLTLTFCLRVRQTGDVIEPEETQRRLHALIQRYLDEGRLDEKLKRHLFVEYLFQPAQSVKLRGEAGRRPPEVAGLLALAQVSLRPTVRQAFRYRVFEVAGAPGPRRIRVSAPTPDAAFTMINLSQPSAQLAVEVVGGAPKALDIQIPASGVAVLLFRGQSAPTVETEGAGGAVRQNDFSPADWRATYFTAPTGTWPQSLAGNGGVADEWQRFRRYMLRLNPPNPANASDPKVVFPLPNEGEKIANLMSWSNRLFEAGGDVARPAGEGQLASTGPGPWFATAYPRTISPAGVVPDKTGRLTYNHLIEDQWAHVYRYYFLPHGRYDRLWQTLAQSDALYPPGTRRPVLENFAAPGDEEGGLDVVLDRIRELAPPLVLFSGRLDREGAAAALAPPGKTWEVIVAKHPEQLLVERNRTLVRQLDYRHLAHTLLRRYAFIPALARLDEGLRHPATADPSSLTERVATGADETAMLVVKKGLEERRFDLPLAGRNNLRGLAAAINENANTGLRAEVIPAQAGGQPPDNARVFHLVLTPPPSEGEQVRLLAAKGDEASDLLREPYRLADKIAYVANADTVAPPATLPAKPEHLSLDALSEDDALSLDIPTRLGVFGKGAVVLQWRALPFFYEHHLMLVAQTSSEVVSPVTALVQRDFEYVSPQPSASLEAVSRPGDTERSLLLRLELKNHWECLPSAGGPGGGGTPAREQWPAENPALYESLVFSALPDTDVIYQVVHEGGVGVVETQAELFFDAAAATGAGPAGPAAGYGVRQMGQKYVATPLRVRPPAGVGEEGPKPFFLETRLEKFSRVTLPGRAEPAGSPPDDSVRKVIEFRGDLTRAAYNRRLFQIFPALGELLPATPTQEDRDRVARRWVAAAAVAATVDLPPELRDKAAFVSAAKKVLVARAFLSAAECEDLKRLYSTQTPADQAAVARFCADIADRQALELFFQGWVSEQPFGSRHDMPPDADLRERVELPPPMSCELVLHVGQLDASDVERLRAALLALLEAHRPDHSFDAAVRRLLAQLDELPEPDDGPESRRVISAEASVGVEQIRELSDGAEVVGGKVRWRGPLREEQANVLRRWAELSDFGATFNTVLDALESLTFRFEFDADELFPQPDELPEVLGGRLEILVPAPPTPPPVTSPPSGEEDSAGEGETEEDSAGEGEAEETEEDPTGEGETEDASSSGTVSSPPESSPPEEAPPAKLIWTGLLLTPEEEAALDALAAEASGFGPSFRQAVGLLLDALRASGDDAAEVVVPVQEPGWRPRPDRSQLSDPLLRERLLIGNGRLRFFGWMTRAEGRRLMDAQEGNRPNQSAVERLFDESLTKGADGGRLTVTARRGSAGVRAGSPVSTLRED